MGQRLSVDTSFLIDVQRERRRGGGGPAHTWLERSADARLALSTVALGEYCEGFGDPEHPLVRLVTTSCEILPVDIEVAAIYARTARRLRREGRLIGTNDLWIAATALRHDLPLLTADAGQFSRVRGLRVETYR